MCAIPPRESPSGCWTMIIDIWLFSNTDGSKPTIPGWWFGTFFIFHNMYIYIWDDPSHWLIFSRWLKPPTRYYLGGEHACYQRVWRSSLYQGSELGYTILPTSHQGWLPPISCSRSLAAAAALVQVIVSQDWTYNKLDLNNRTKIYTTKMMM